MIKIDENILYMLIDWVCLLIVVIVYPFAYWRGMTAETRRRVREYRKQQKNRPRATKRIV